MKKLILILLFSICYSSYAQKIIPVEIILKNEDTLKGKMKYRSYPFTKNHMYMYGFINKVKFRDELGQKRKIKSEEILELKFTDLNGNARKFISKTEFKDLVEVIYINKIEWYKQYVFSIEEHYEYVFDEFFDSDGNRLTLRESRSPNKKRKLLKEFTKQNPEINLFIEENKMIDEFFLKIIKMYENTI